MLCTFSLRFIFLRQIADLQERPQQVVLCDPVKNLNQINRLPEVPNTL